jgi:hypothetical protein
MSPIGPLSQEPVDPEPQAELPDLQKAMAEGNERRAAP